MPTPPVRSLIDNRIRETEGLIDTRIREKQTMIEELRGDIETVAESRPVPLRGSSPRPRSRSAA